MTARRDVSRTHRQPHLPRIAGTPGTTRAPSLSSVGMRRLLGRRYGILPRRAAPCPCSRHWTMRPAMSHNKKGRDDGPPDDSATHCRPRTSPFVWGLAGDPPLNRHAVTATHRGAFWLVRHPQPGPGASARSMGIVACRRPARARRTTSRVGRCGSARRRRRRAPGVYGPARSCP